MNSNDPQVINRENAHAPKPLEQELRSALDQIALALRGLKFGNINVVVQDGVVVQIDRTEKVRLKATTR